MKKPVSIALAAVLSIVMLLSSVRFSEFGSYDVVTRGLYRNGTVHTLKEGNNFVSSIVQTPKWECEIARHTDSYGAGKSDRACALQWAESMAPPTTEWSKTYGGLNDDVALSVVQASDGGYAIAGYTNSSGSFDFWLVKTDSAGSHLWNKTYGGVAAQEYAYSMVQTSDGGYAIAGYNASIGDALLVRTDSNGNQLWSKTYGGPGNDTANSVVEASDGGYVLAGSTDSYGAGKSDFWLVRTDSYGTQMWNKTYGGPGNDTANSVVEASDRGYDSVDEASDGGYVLAGSTDSYGAGKSDFWLVKTNAAGNQIWSRTYGGPGNDIASSIVRSFDNWGYVLAGSTDSYGAGKNDFWLVRTDSYSAQMWNKTYGGPGDDVASSVVQSLDLGFALAGYTTSYGAGSSDFWLVRTDLDGNHQWNETGEGPGDDVASSVVQTTDGGYAMAGITKPYGAINGDIRLVKLTAVTYDLDIPLPSGAHVYVNFDSNWTTEDKLAVSSNLTTYVPIMWTDFWAINNSAFVTMIRGPGMGWASAGINRDNHGNIVSYSGTVGLGGWGEGWLMILLHEWTHDFQFWIPSYEFGVGQHLEAVANAFANVLILKQLGWNSSEYRPEKKRDGGQLIAPLDYGMADYGFALLYNGYELLRGWEELWSYDNLAFKKFNTLVASLPLGTTPVKVRDIAKTALFESYPDYAYDGLSIDDWLNGFSFFNGVADLPEGVKMMQWEGVNSDRFIDLARDYIPPPFSNGTVVQFDGIVVMKQNGTVTKIPVSSFDVTIRDGQTRELLYSNMSQPAYRSIDLYDGSVYFYFWGGIPFRDLLRIDVVAHLTVGGDLPLTAYLAARHDYAGNRVVFFLNKDGYAEGTGLSNVGPINNGVLKWSAGNNVEANVTWGGQTYTYSIENVMAHQSIPLTQIAVPLYQTRTLISPLTQTVNVFDLAQLEVHISPKVTMGNVTIFHSTNLADWTPVASATPINGYVSLKFQLSSDGIHYFKASWEGDSTLNPSQSSVVSVNVSARADITPPVANAGLGQTVNEDVLVQFDGSGSTDNVGITSYVWTFVDGTPRTLTGQTSSYAFSNPGVYVVTLNVSDAVGNWNTDATTITVRDGTPPTIGTPIRSPSADVNQYQQVTISVNIVDTGSGVNNASLFYTLNNGSTWETPTLMTYNAVTSNYEASIPGQASDTWVKYMILAYDNNGNSQTANNAGQYYAFRVTPEFTAPSAILLFLTATTLTLIALKRTRRNRDRNQP